MQETTEKLIKYIGKANLYRIKIVFPAVCSAENSPRIVLSPGKVIMQRQHTKEAPQQSTQ